ncbi:hypothetical protein L7F22_042367 [Adiantum nelumboides]|nr:hypothetical protein [Adiantum nelumboides]
MAMASMTDSERTGISRSAFCSLPVAYIRSAQLTETVGLCRSLSKWQPLIDARNILRPETVESLYIAFHLTGDPIYRQWGWEIFTAFRDVARVPDGHKSGRAGVYAASATSMQTPRTQNS